jgi:hypothetical protein
MPPAGPIHRSLPPFEPSATGYPSWKPQTRCWAFRTRGHDAVAGRCGLIIEMRNSREIACFWRRTARSEGGFYLNGGFEKTSRSCSGSSRSGVAVCPSGLIRADASSVSSVRRQEHGGTRQQEASEPGRRGLPSPLSYWRDRPPRFRTLTEAGVRRLVYDVLVFPA